MLVERQKHRSTGQNRSPEVDSHKYAQIISDKYAKAINGKKVAFSTIAAGTIGYPCAKKEKKIFDLNLATYTDQKRIIDLNVKSIRIEFLEGNIKEYHSDVILGKNFLNFISKA